MMALKVSTGFVAGKHFASPVSTSNTALCFGHSTSLDYQSRNAGESEK